MLVDLSNAVGDYLHDVFVVQLDSWVLLGFVAQALLHDALRGAVDRVRARRPQRHPGRVLVFSIGGGMLLFVYALYRRDPVFILGQGFGVFVYLRNLYFVMRERKQARRRRRSAEQRRRALRDPAGRLVIGVGELQAARARRGSADDLQAHRQAARAEADRHRDRRTARHGDRDHHLHPAVVGVHHLAGDFFRPVDVGVEREHLRGRQHKIVVVLEERARGLIPRGAHPEAS